MLALKMLPVLLVSGLLLLAAAPPAGAQSNYASQANNVEYVGDGLPEQTILDGKVTKLDDLSPVIFLNRTKAALNCAAGSMQVELKFNAPFFGLAYADFDGNSACRVAGNGEHSYRLELPLKGCGTRQEPQRVFTNNIVVRFHPSFQQVVDEIITIVCRYPPPVAPIPAGLPSFIQEDVVPAGALEPPLKGFQILLIICAILFLSLLLLGLGCSYYCLRRRHVTVIRPQISSIGTGNLSMFEGVKIPRVHAPVVVAGAPPSSAGSDGLLISDTLPSDYPSESHSEAEDVDTRSLPASSAGSSSSATYAPDAFVHEVAPQIQVPRLPLVAAKEAPVFDVQVRVQRQAPAAPPSLQLSTSDAEERSHVSAIADSPQVSHVPELHPPPRHVQPAPTFTRILRRHQQEPATKRPPPPIAPDTSRHEVDDVFLRTVTERRTTEDVERHQRRVTEFYTRPADGQRWDVTIKNYPLARRDPPEWESFSDVSSTSGLVVPTTQPERGVVGAPPAPIADNKVPLDSPQMIAHLEQYQVPAENAGVANWSVLLRVLQPAAGEDVDEDGGGAVIDNAETFNAQLTHADRMKWRQIITTESTLRTLLTAASSRVEYERIRHDQRYAGLFEPHKWDVIIRILTPEERARGAGAGGARYRKRTADWETRSRRSSLPTLYEYDSDGGSSLRTLVGEPQLQQQAPPSGRSRRTSRSSWRSEADVRSMSELFVDFRQHQLLHQLPHDARSDASSCDAASLARSLSQPSLARSASEFTERWVAPSRYDTASEFTSPEGTPRSQRSSRIQALHVPRGHLHHHHQQQQQVAMSTTSTRQAEFRSEASASFMATSSGAKNWFADNDSETSYK